MGRPAGWMEELTGRSPMKSPGKPSLRREVEREFWLKIAEGVSSEDAALAVGVSQAAGCRWFRQGGGMPLFQLTGLSGRYLSFDEREQIALLRAQGLGVRAIAREVGRAPSTISREVRRNAATRGGRLEYRAGVAQWKAELMARRPKESKLASNERLRAYVADRLAGQLERPDGEAVAGPEARFKGRRHGPRQDRRWAKAWSPEQISNRLRVDFPHDKTMRISHEAIYQALYVQGRGALKRELVACLRTGRALRVPRARTRGRGKKSVTPETMISQLPAEADDRAVPGHWEGDLIIGLNRSAIGTLVERTTRYTMLLHYPQWKATANNPEPKTARRWPATAPKRFATPSQNRSPSSPNTFADPWHGTKVPRWHNTPSSPSPPGSRSTSATPTAPGNEEQTRTPTDCCANTSPTAPTSPDTPAKCPVSSFLAQSAV